MSDVRKILRHLEQYGSITSLEAIEQYGITRLSAKIFTLRQKGYLIGTIKDYVLISGKQRTFARYVLKKGR